MIVNNQEQLPLSSGDIPQTSLPQPSIALQTVTVTKPFSMTPPALTPRPSPRTAPCGCPGQDQMHDLLHLPRRPQPHRMVQLMMQLQADVHNRSEWAFCTHTRGRLTRKYNHV